MRVPRRRPFACSASAARGSTAFSLLLSGDRRVTPGSRRHVSFASGQCEHDDRPGNARYGRARPRRPFRVGERRRMFAVPSCPSRLELDRRAPGAPRAAHVRVRRAGAPRARPLRPLPRARRPASWRPRARSGAKRCGRLGRRACAAGSTAKSLPGDDDAAVRLPYRLRCAFPSCAGKVIRRRPRHGRGSSQEVQVAHREPERQLDPRRPLTCITREPRRAPSGSPLAGLARTHDRGER
jgi:hypothetical protein